MAVKMPCNATAILLAFYSTHSLHSGHITLPKNGVLLSPTVHNMSDLLLNLKPSTLLREGS